jgi:hypothetical protein
MNILKRFKQYDQGKLYNTVLINKEYITSINEFGDMSDVHLICGSKYSVKTEPLLEWLYINKDLEE